LILLSGPASTGDVDSVSTRPTRRTFPSFDITKNLITDKIRETDTANRLSRSVGPCRNSRVIIHARPQHHDGYMEI
jgi:hypothetical protein